MRNICEVGQLDHIAEIRSGGGQAAAQILEDLPRLCRRIARAGSSRPTAKFSRACALVICQMAPGMIVRAGAGIRTKDTGMTRTGADIVDMKFEVAVLPVADADRAKAFYQGLGWRLDADISVAADYRVVQFTPPNSPASIQFGTGVSTMAPGSVENLYLIVADIAAARDELISHGADVSQIWHGAGLNASRHAPGPDPERGSYRNFASFADPDGNSWLLQEIKERLPGRVWPTDVSALAGLLHETAERHGSFEKVAPPHNWWDWYAAYLDARERGITPEDAAAAAGRYMADVKHVVA